MKSKEKNLYLVTMGDEYELPVFTGTSEECARFLGVSTSRLFNIVSKIKNGRMTSTRDGYKIFNIDSKPWELELCDCICPGMEEEE